MKFLDANGLALFTKKIFNKFVSNVSGADNKITITKGDGTTNEINLNEVLKTDEIAENPPEDDNSLKIASTSWVQVFVATMVFKLISKLAGTEETGVSSSGSFLGVNWLIAQNGYISLGKFFGGFIFQWGKWQCVDVGTFPISYVQSSSIVIGIHVGKSSGINIVLDSDRIGSKTSFLFLSPDETKYAVYYWSIGK